MSGMSLTKKLILSFGIVFISFAIFGLSINSYFKSITAEKNNLQDWFKSSVAVSKITYAIATTHRIIYERMDNPTSTELEIEQKAMMKIVDDSFTEYQNALDNGDYDTEEERQRDQKMLEIDKQKWIAYKKEAEKLETVIKTNRAQAEIILHGSLEKTFDEVHKAMNADCDDCMNGLGEAVDVSEGIFIAIEGMVQFISIFIIVILVIIVVILVLLAKNINQSVEEIVTVTEKAAQGDLSQEVQTSAADEFGIIANQFNSMMRNTRRVLGRVQHASTEVSNGSNKMGEGIHQTKDLLEKITSAITSATDNTKVQVEIIKDTEEKVQVMEQSIEQSIKAMQAGLNSVKQTAEQATRGNQLAEDTVRQMNDIAESVEKSAKIVQELGENSKEIGSIVEVISGIAEQTNLLALNAAIEAARAGELGKGFAVVADEVRKLAEGSKESVLKIGGIIEKIQVTTEQAVEIMNASRERVNAGKDNVQATGNSFYEIDEMIRQAEDNSNQVMKIINSLKAPIIDIVNRTAKMSSMSDDIAQKMQSISVATERQTDDIISISDNSEQLMELSKTLETTVKEFKL